MNLLDLSRQFERAAIDIGREARRIVQDTLQEAKDLAEEATAGEYSQRELEQMDHPYARRHRRPLLDPDIINIDSGGVHEGWRVRGPHVQANLISGQLVNVDPKFEEYLAPGTVTMVERDPLAKVAEDIEPKFYRRMSVLGKGNL